MKAIIAARGGYGTVRIMDTLDFVRLWTNRNGLLGFSDITYFHAQLIVILVWKRCMLLCHDHLSGKYTRLRFSR
jgi:hypothetical protein